MYNIGQDPSPKITSFLKSLDDAVGKHTAVEKAPFRLKEPHIEK